MKLDNATVLITGANRGIGLAFARAALARGARKVYAGARDPANVRLAGVEPIRLDVTRPDDIAAAVRHCGDVTLLINNAGIATGANLVTGDLDMVREDLETHLFGTLRVIRAFAPALAASGGGAVVNILSVLSWVATEGTGSYAVAKAAEWNMTNGVRLELAGQRTLVQGVHLGAADTDMMAGRDAPMIDPADVARAGLDGVQAGLIEVLVDDPSRFVKAALSGDPAQLYSPPPGN
jgi:NAD(P)-dependent dehydrogenase (short-subunit alcohol dehydrogenase family)